MIKKVISILLVIGTILILYMSITFFSESNNSLIEKIFDVTRSVNINDLIIKVKYIGGNLIDESISYGNVLEKDIVLTNKNDEPVTYSITFKEVEISNDKLTYTLKASTDEETYLPLLKNIPVTSNMHLAYNLVIEPKTKLYLRVEFKSNHEGELTNIKGALNIENNLSERDLFTNNTKLIDSEINKKIEELNGIVVPNYYLLNLRELSEEVSDDYKGYVVIDATDISDIKHIYYIYSNSLMLNGYTYTKDFNKEDIVKKDNKIQSYNDTSICSLLTKNPCAKFSSLKKNNKGTEQDFYNSVKELITKTESIYKSSNNTLIYDIKKDIDPKTNLRGYILINNVKVSKPEYYLYITNNIFMISGYNYTKNGDFDITTPTIRAYNETAFNLSTSTINTVCTFSGFTNCVDINGVIIK